MVAQVWLRLNKTKPTPVIINRLNFWIGVFSDHRLYNINIATDGVELPKNYNDFHLIKPADIKGNADCQKYFSLLKKYTAPVWHEADSISSAPFFYLKNSETIITVNATDSMFVGAVPRYSAAALKHLEGHPDTPFLSYDMNYSAHVPPNGLFLKNYWNFSLLIGKTRAVRDCILRATQIAAPPVPPWNGINLEYLMSLAILDSDFDYVNFTAPGKLIIENPNAGRHFARFNIESGNVESNHYEQIESAPPHSKTLVII